MTAGFTEAKPASGPYDLMFTLLKNASLSKNINNYIYDKEYEMIDTDNCSRRASQLQKSVALCRAATPTRDRTGYHLNVFIDV